MRHAFVAISCTATIILLTVTSAQAIEPVEQRNSETRGIVTDTYLVREALSEPDTPEVLRRVLKRAPYASLSQAEYAELLERTALEFPESRVAHEALANSLIGHSDEKGPDFARGVQELQRAAELSFRYGVVRYEPQLPHYLALTGDEAGLHHYAQRALELLPEGRERYSVYLYYAKALAVFKRPLADEMFKRAIAVRPDGQWGAYEFYVRYLLAERQYERVLLLLTPAILDKAPIMRDYFQRVRCEAISGLGRSADANEECSAKPGGPLGAPRRTIGGRIGERGTAKVDYPHDSNQRDDCRNQFQCFTHNACKVGGCWCFHTFVWNLAEIALNEARNEAPGAQNSIAWTLRNRAVRTSTMGCGGFPGANTGCTSGCPSPGNLQMCELQKKYCCAIHASNQFNRTHIPVPEENIPYDLIGRMRRVVDGELPDPVSGYIPTGASGCVLNDCDGSAYCNRFGSSYEAAPEGPIFFYGNIATGYRCYGYMPGISTACAIVASEKCGNSTDGSGSDNCFLRETRERIWTSGFTCVSGCNWNGSELVLTLNGHATKTPTETPAFKTGGKALVITAALSSSGAGATMRVRLIDPNGAVVHDFGTLPVTSTTFTDFEFRSNTLIDGTSINRVWILNEASGALAIRSVKMRD